jgi:hypothetical protein
MGNAYNVLVRKPDRKILLEILRRRRENKIRMDLGEIGCEGVECIHVAQERDQWRDPVNTAMNLRVP